VIAQLQLLLLKWNLWLTIPSLICTQSARVKEKFEFTALLVASVFTNILTEILMPLNPSHVISKLINRMCGNKPVNGMMYTTTQWEAIIIVIKINEAKSAYCNTWQNFSFPIQNFIFLISPKRLEVIQYGNSIPNSLNAKTSFPMHKD